MARRAVLMYAGLALLSTSILGAAIFIAMMAGPL